MAKPGSTIIQLISSLLWTCISTTPVQQKQLIYDKILSSQECIEQLLFSASIVFAPGLSEILQASTPPNVSYFRKLPTNHKKRWAVYLLVLEKAGFKSKIYIGSGTHAKSGVAARFAQYDAATVWLPIGVSTALKESYTIVRKGLLCWAPIPPVALVPVLRVLFCALEAAFTFGFWTMRSKSEFGYGLTHLCFWDRDAMTYDGLCTHSPLREVPAGDHNLSAEELEAQAIAAKERSRENYHKAVERAKAANPAEFKAKKNRKEKNWVSKNPDKFNAIRKRSSSKAVKEQRHYCEVCDHAFAVKRALRIHLVGPRHAAKARQLGMDVAYDDAMRKRPLPRS